MRLDFLSGATRLHMVLDACDDWTESGASEKFLRQPAKTSGHEANSRREIWVVRRTQLLLSLWAILPESICKSIERCPVRSSAQLRSAAIVSSRARDGIFEPQGYCERF